MDGLGGIGCVGLISTSSHCGLSKAIEFLPAVQAPKAVRRG